MDYDHAKEQPRRAGVRRRHEPEETEAHAPKLRNVRVIYEVPVAKMKYNNTIFDIVMQHIDEGNGQCSWKVKINAEELLPQLPFRPDRSVLSARNG